MGTLNTFWYFRVLLGTFGYFWVLLSTIEYFRVLMGIFFVLLSTFQVRNLSGNVKKLSEIIRILSKIDNKQKREKNAFSVRLA